MTGDIAPDSPELPDMRALTGQLEREVRAFHEHVRFDDRVEADAADALAYAIFNAEQADADRKET